MSLKDILGEPNFLGEIRIVDTPSRWGKGYPKSTSEKTFYTYREYFMGNEHKNWTRLLEYEVEELRRQGKL